MDLKEQRKKEVAAVFLEQYSAFVASSIKSNEVWLWFFSSATDLLVEKMK